MRCPNGLHPLGIWAICLSSALQAQSRNANWVSECWASFSTAGISLLPVPQDYVERHVSISDPSAHLMLTIGGAGSSEPIGILDHTFQPIANHPPTDFWLSNMTPNNAVFIPVPGHPERTFLFFHRSFSFDVRKYGWLEIGPDGPGGQLRMTDIGPQYFMLNPAIKCTGIAHANGEDYWFITQAVGTNEVHAFRIGDLGVEEGPIISPGGIIINDSSRSGFMVASMQGDHLVSEAYDQLNQTLPTFELYAFDPSTGQATYEHTFESMSGTHWGAEFSPSGRFLYFLRGESNSGTFPHTIYQYDLMAADLEASRAVVDTHENFLGGAGSIQNNLCLAPDGRIYGNRYPISSFAIINFPDEAAPACGYEEDGILLDSCTVGVPQPLKYYHDDAALGVTAVERLALRVWPNPVMEQGVVSGVGDGQIHLRWCDALGRVIKEGSSLAQDGRVTVDVQALPNGAYVLNVTPKNGMPASVRVSVMH